MDIIFEIFGLKSELVYIWTTFTILLTLVKLGRFFFFGSCLEKGIKPFFVLHERNGREFYRQGRVASKSNFNKKNKSCKTVLSSL